MNVRDVWIIGIHTFLVVLGLLMIVLQMIWGIVPFQYLLVDLNEASRQIIYRLWSVGWILVIGIGVALRELTSGQNRKRFLSTFLITVLIGIGIPIIFGGFGVLNDIASGTDITRGNLVFGLDAMGAQVIEWYYITKILFMAAPMAVIIVGVIMIFRSEGVDGYVTAILEVFAAIGIFVFANIALGWAGIELFDFNPSTAVQGPITPSAIMSLIT
jgi:hypothetical protein